MVRVHLARLLRRRVVAGADGPDRLVGDRYAGHVGGRDPFEAAGELRSGHGLGLAGLALVERLAHAQHDLEAGLQPGGDLAAHQLVALAVEVAPLGVAEDHRVGPHVAQHRGADLARERARGLVAAVLGPDTDG